MDATFSASDTLVSPRFIDTHTHLDDEAFDGERDEVIARASSQGVGKLVNIGYAPSRWESTIALAATNANIWIALGLHPGHADEWTDETLPALERLVRLHHPVAIGEIGLDFTHPTPDRELQHQVFEAQLGLAHALNLPVVIHQRSAGAECTAVLQSITESQTIVLHSFDGDTDLLRLGLERGWFFGVGGLMTRKSSEQLREALSTVPLNQIVLETDSPYLVPRGSKLRRNTPESIPHLASILADLLHVTVDDVAHHTTAAAERIFGLKGCRDDE